MSLLESTHFDIENPTGLNCYARTTQLISEGEFGLTPFREGKDAPAHKEQPVWVLHLNSLW